MIGISVMLSEALHHLVRDEAKHPRLWRDFQLAFKIFPPPSAGSE
jgi:hypothetical protein